MAKYSLSDFKSGLEWKTQASIDLFKKIAIDNNGWEFLKSTRDKYYETSTPKEAEKRWRNMSMKLVSKRLAEFTGLNPHDKEIKSMAQTKSEQFKTKFVEIYMYLVAYKSEQTLNILSSCEDTSTPKCTSKLDIIEDMIKIFKTNNLEEKQALKIISELSLV